MLICDKNTCAGCGNNTTNEKNPIERANVEGLKMVCASATRQVKLRHKVRKIKNPGVVKRKGEEICKESK
jgi:hypothetical protein